MEKKFNVIMKEINDKDMDYISTDNLKLNDESAKACYEIIREEYLHDFARSDKLDNKVYITLTFCGFLFVLITGLAEKLFSFNLPEDAKGLMLIIIYMCGALVTIGLFIYVLIKLIRLLRPMSVQRIDPNYILENNLQKQTPYTIYTVCATKATYAINTINGEMENKNREYSKCMKLIVPIVLLTFSLQFVKFFIT